LKAAKVEFFKDVPGIFNSDPKKEPQALHIPYLSYDDALRIISTGAKVLQRRSVEMAKRNLIPLHVFSFHDVGNQQQSGTLIGSMDADRPSLCVYEEDA
jgi:aspartate kinase